MERNKRVPSRSARQPQLYSFPQSLIIAFAPHRPQPPAQDDCEKIQDPSALIATGTRPTPSSPTSYPLSDLWTRTISSSNNGGARSVNARIHSLLSSFSPARARSRDEQVSKLSSLVNEIIMGQWSSHPASDLNLVCFPFLSRVRSLVPSILAWQSLRWNCCPRLLCQHRSPSFLSYFPLSFILDDFPLSQPLS